MRDLPRRRRDLPRMLGDAARRLNFSLFNLPASGRVTLAGSALCGAALCVPWLQVSDGGTPVAAGAFSALAGYAGWVTLPILGLLCFLTLSTRRKEAIKSKLSIPFYDYTVSVFGGLAVLLLATTVFFMGLGFARTVGGAVKVDVAASGITFQIVGALLVMAGGWINYREKKRELLHMIYLENLAQKETDLESYAQLLGKPAAAPADRSNMSLPV